MVYIYFISLTPPSLQTLHNLHYITPSYLHTWQCIEGNCIAKCRDSGRVEMQVYGPGETGRENSN